MISKFGLASVVVLLSVCGTVRAAPRGETRFWSFTGKLDGTQPRGDLIFGTDGQLYGTASSGGINQSGTIFRLSPNATTPNEETIYNFTGGTDGSLPSAALLQLGDGSFYTTAARDGAGNAGTVIELTPPAAGQTAWVEKTLWSFTGGNDGAQPIGGLIADRSGSHVLYGTTNFGGAYGLGVVFSLTPPVNEQGNWTEQTLWTFAGGADGAKPASALVQGPDGTLYGTASAGGAAAAGVVFALTPPGSSASAWVFAPIWTFSGGADGATPIARPILDAAGALYGTTEFGGGGDCAQARYPFYNAPESESAYAFDAAYVPVGGNHCGVVFKLDPPAVPGQPWTQAILWTFQAGFDGGNPVGPVLLDSSGGLHGMTTLYGDPGPNSLNQYGDKGNVFVLTPPAQSGGTYMETTTLSLSSFRNGVYPRAGFVAGPNSLYYTSATHGGDTWVHTREEGYGSIIGVK